jgi:hypothetical protein
MLYIAAVDLTCTELYSSLVFAIFLTIFFDCFF